MPATSDAAAANMPGAAITYDIVALRPGRYRPSQICRYEDGHKYVETDAPLLSFR